MLTERRFMMNIKTKKMINGGIWLLIIAGFIIFMMTGPGCILQETPEVNGTTAAFKAAIPNSDKIKISVSDSSSAFAKSSLTEEGEVASYYGWAKALAVSLNADLVHLLEIIDAITNDSSILSIATEGAHVWGPFTHTDGITYKFTMDKDGDTYTIDFSATSDLVTPAGTYITLLDGTVEESLDVTDAGSNQGNFTIYSADRGTVIGEDDMQGTMDIEYDTRYEGKKFFYVAFNDVVTEDYSGTPLEGYYDYDEDQDAASGLPVIAYTISIKNDLLPSSDSLLEDVSLTGRWVGETMDSAGVADVSMTGGDVGASEIKLSECWDSATLSIFFASNANPAAGYGDSEDCSFTPIYTGE